MPVLQRTDSSIFAAFSAEAAASTLKSPPPYLDLAWREGPAGRWVADATPLARISFERTRKGPREAGMQMLGDVVHWDLSKAPPEPRLSLRLRA